MTAGCELRLEENLTRAREEDVASVYGYTGTLRANSQGRVVGWPCLKAALYDPVAKVNLTEPRRLTEAGANTRPLFGST